jgi:GTPase SAR1 family protein
MGGSAHAKSSISAHKAEFITTLNLAQMDNWRVAMLGDGGVGKTALAVQVSHCL